MFATTNLREKDINGLKTHGISGKSKFREQRSVKKVMPPHAESCRDMKVLITIYLLDKDTTVKMASNSQLLR